MSSLTNVLPFVLLLLAICGNSAQSTSRILGGEDADNGEFPYVASVRLDSAHFCGGTIIGQRHILTAAHCVVDDNNKVVDVERVSVRVGSTNQFAGGKLVYVASIEVHPGHVEFTNDLAVLILSTSLVLNDKIAVIPLATTGTEKPPVGAKVEVAGWGEQSSGATPYKLQATFFTMASEADCRNAHAEHDDSTICLAHNLKQGSCRGDAGNGAVYDKKLVGVSSFVVGACGSRYPDVFAKVSYFSTWINSLL